MDGYEKKPVVDTPLGEFMRAFFLRQLKGPSGQAMVQRLSDTLTLQLLEVIAQEMRAIGKQNGGMVDVEKFLARILPPRQ